MVEFVVREMTTADRAVWADMRAALWPGEDSRDHPRWIDEILLGRDAWGFMAETTHGTPAGFAEVSVRKYANGCETHPVAFLEGIWVQTEFRRQGVGRRLILHLEGFLIGHGFSELGSDALIANQSSHAAHLGWGFSETERVVYFRKRLVG